MTAVSGEIASPPAPPAVPDGMITLDKKEHDRLQAELRRAQKAIAEKEEADQKRAAAERERLAREAGDFDKALAEERAEKEALKRKLVERDKRDAVRDAIAKLGLTGSKAALVTKLADLAAVAETDSGFDASEAVEAVVAEYPDLLGTPADPEPEPTPIRRNGPTPRAAGDKPFEGFVSPEEYARVPQSVRLTREFQERIRLSRPHWAKKFPAASLPSGND